MSRRLFASLAALAPGIRAAEPGGIVPQTGPSAEPHGWPAAPPAGPPGQSTTGPPAPPWERQFILLVNVAYLEFDSIARHFIEQEPSTWFGGAELHLFPFHSPDHPPLQIFDMSRIAQAESGAVEALLGKAIGAPMLAAERERCALVAEQALAEEIREFANPALPAEPAGWGRLFTASVIAARIRALTPATAETQREDAGLMALAADLARQRGECTVRIRQAYDGSLVFEPVA